MKLKWLALMGMGLCAPLAYAQSGTEILQSQCAACHALQKPADATLDRLWQRKGPDLWYAGDKFNEAWLVQWLQNPTRIRPAGELYFRHVKAGAKQDVVDESSLTAHPKLAADDAQAAAKALMALAPAGLVEKGAFKNQPVPAMIGTMFFNKLRGCASCHRSKPDFGGQSGPELYTAGERLQPDYILAYMKDPQKFDPHVWMPTLHMNDADLQRLTGYVVGLSKKEGH